MSSPPKANTKPAVKAAAIEECAQAQSSSFFTNSAILVSVMALFGALTVAQLIVSYTSNVLVLASDAIAQVRLCQ